MENLYASLGLSSVIKNERSQSYGTEQSYSADHPRKPPHDQSLDMTVKAMNSFVIAAGNIFHGDRLIKYVIREIMEICFSVDLLVPVTEQTWTVFIPTSNPIKELMKIWKRKDRLRPNDQNHMDKLCSWLLSCIQLQFNASNMIIAAQFNQELFKKLYTQEIKVQVVQAAIRIQSIVRRFLSNKKLIHYLATTQSVNDSRTLAIMRVQLAKSGKKQRFGGGRLTSKRERDAPSIDPSANGLFRADLSMQDDLPEELRREYLEAQERGRRVGATSLEAHRAHAPVTPATERRRLRPAFSGSPRRAPPAEITFNSSEESLGVGVGVGVRNALGVDVPYVSLFEPSPPKEAARKVDNGTFSSSSRSAYAAQTLSATRPTSKESSSLLAMIKAHNDNLMNRPGRKYKDPRTVAVQWMRVEMSSLVRKVDALEQELLDQRAFNEQVVALVKTEMSKMRRGVARATHRAAEKAREEAVEAVTAKVLELQLGREKEEKDREEVLLEELDALQRRWMKKWRASVSGGRGNARVVEQEEDRGSWVDTSQEGGGGRGGRGEKEEEEDDASETSLERRIRENSVTRKTRKIRRSRKGGGGSQSFSSAPSADTSTALGTHSLESIEERRDGGDDDEYGRGDGDGDATEEGNLSETSLERRLRLNATARAARKGNRSTRRRRGHRREELSQSTEEGLAAVPDERERERRGAGEGEEGEGEGEEGTGGELSETSLERRIRLKAEQRADKNHLRHSKRSSRRRRHGDETSATARGQEQEPGQVRSGGRRVGGRARGGRHRSHRHYRGRATSPIHESEVESLQDNDEEGERERERDPREEMADNGAGGEVQEREGERDGEGEGDDQEEEDEEDQNNGDGDNEIRAVFFINDKKPTPPAQEKKPIPEPTPPPMPLQKTNAGKSPRHSKAQAADPPPIQPIQRPNLVESRDESGQSADEKGKRVIAAAGNSPQRCVDTIERGRDGSD